MAETSGGLPHPPRPVAADPELWHACAGAISQPPQVGSSVVYFPQGHAEQVSPLLLHDLPAFAPACIACKVTAIDYLADSETDEAYARMCLHPLSGSEVHDAAIDDDADHSESPSFCHESKSKPISFAKTLTQSDANNGGGFSIPRYCAETIFPRLDYAHNPPVQIILARDIHGTVWKFRHIYRGTPRRHLLTTGWSNFVNRKKLVAGDVIIFVRSSTGQLCVGIRRSMKGSRVQHQVPSSQCGLMKTGAADQVDHLLHMQEAPAPPLSNMAAGNCNRPRSFSRHRNIPVTTQSVVEAATAASCGQPFQILYYPRASASEFCVKSHLVKKALQHNWAPGMRLKMAIETEDASRTSWYMGTVLKVGEVDPVRWPKSPWKVLQVTWDEGVLQGMQRVSPWQVDLVSPMLLPPLSWPRKKLRLLHPRELHIEHSQLGDTPPMIGYQGATLASYTHQQYYEFQQPDGLHPSMEGARHGPTNYDGLPVQDFAIGMQPGLWLGHGSLQSQIQHAGATQLVPNLGLGITTAPEPIATGGGENQLVTLTVGSSSSSEPALSSTASLCDEGGSSSSRCVQFFLFGKAIDIVQPASAEPLQQLVSPANGPNVLGQEVMSEGPQSEASLSAEGSSVETLEAANLHLQQGESFSAS